MKFEGIHIYTLPFANFRRGAAVTIPWIGIFVGKGFENDKDLLRHEFGHILQFRQWGFWTFWFRVTPTSLVSAKNSRKHAANHMHTWTEWSANNLSYNYFLCPKDWNFNLFPITPIKSSKRS
ncbi:MAG: hypothetical protein QM751_00840 [Paludibacteraceae bacterium]